MEILERFMKEVKLATQEYRYQIMWSRKNGGRCNRCTPIARLYLEIAVCLYNTERKKILK
jgi:hypothetical protein